MIAISCPFALWKKRFHYYYRSQTKLREGNVFRGVCLATGGVSVSGSMFLLGGPRDPPGLRPPSPRDPTIFPEQRSPPCTAKRELYASYWNTFLSVWFRHFILLVDAVADLSKSQWMDKYTKALFLEFILYNANVNLFSYVTVLLEWPRTNSPLYSLKVHSFR